MQERVAGTTGLCRTHWGSLLHLIPKAYGRLPSSGDTLRIPQILASFYPTGFVPYLKPSAGMVGTALPWFWGLQGHRGDHLLHKKL